MNSNQKKILVMVGIVVFIIIFGKFGPLAIYPGFKAGVFYQGDPDAVQVGNEFTCPDAGGCFNVKGQMVLYRVREGYSDVIIYKEPTRPDILTDSMKNGEEVGVFTMTGWKVPSNAIIGNYYWRTKVYYYDIVGLQHTKEIIDPFRIESKPETKQCSGDVKSAYCEGNNIIKKVYVGEYVSDKREECGVEKVTITTCEHGCDSASVQCIQPKCTEDVTYRCPDGTTIIRMRCSNGNLVETGTVCEGAETCFDGTKNQDETGTDCGGVCPPCATVDNDGYVIMQNECVYVDRNPRYTTIAECEKALPLKKEVYLLFGGAIIFLAIIYFKKVKK